MIIPTQILEEAGFETEFMALDMTKIPLWLIGRSGQRLTLPEP